MSFLAKCAACLLALLLAGCSSTTSRNAGRVADWEDLDAPDETPSTSAVTPLVTAPQPPPATSRSPAPDPIEPGFRSTWVSLPEWTRVRGLAMPARLSAGPASAYSVKSTNGVLVVTAGSLIAHWGGLELRLGFAPQLINDHLYVHSLDLVKTLQPLLLDARVSRLPRGSTIVIDPGHGGTDVGTKSVLHDHYEKELTLDWAIRLRSLLAARGYQVFLTRSSDVEIALSNRVAFASQHHADAFISLHFNSAGEDSNEAGLETYCLTPSGMPSSITRGFADEASLKFPNNAFDGQNLRLALNVHRALLQVNGHVDRGVRRARFPGVLRGQERPAILIEGGYLSNAHEAGLISEPAYRQQLAEAVARALIPTAEVASQNLPVPHPEPTNGEHPQLKNVAPANSAVTREPGSLGNGQPANDSIE